MNNRIREFHRLQDDWCAFVAKRVARRRVFETYDSNDVACIRLVDFSTAVGVHSYKTTDSFSLVFGGVVYVRTLCQYAGIYAEESKLSDKRVGSYLKRKTAELLCIGRLSCYLAVLLARLCSRHVWNVGRSRQIIYDRVKQKLRAFVAKRSSAECRSYLHIDSSLSNDRLQQRLRHCLNAYVALKELLHQRIVKLCNLFYQSRSQFLCLVCILGRYFFLGENFTVFAFIVVSLHCQKVDYSFEVLLSADRTLHSKCVGAKSVVHHFDSSEIIAVVFVHLVDECNSRYVVLRSLSPHRLRLRLYAASCAKQCDCAVQDTERTLNFYREVNVSGGVDKVDTGTLPMRGGSSRRDCYTSLLLLLHPVHRSGAFVNFADLVIDTRIEKDSFTRRCLSCVDVRHNTDISCIFQRIFSCHFLPLI